jgi:hypothetical protein
MTRVPRLSILLCLFAVAIVSCDRSSEQESLAPADYSSWRSTTSTVLDYPIPGHADTFRRIYINPTGQGVQVDREGAENVYRYPRDTIIVKEIFESEPTSPEDSPTRLTVMVKDPDHEAAAGGWVWIMKDPQNGDEVIQQTAFCVSCHNNANEPHPYGDRNEGGEFRDFVFFPYQPRE